MRPAVRLALATLAVSALAGLCIHYGATYPDGWPHPTGEQLEDDYDRYVGDRVLVFGEVQTVDREANAITIHVTTRAETVAAELEVSDADVRVEPGGTVQVYGVLEADRTMRADEIVVVNRDRTALLFKYGASVAGALLAAAFFFAHWRIDPRAVGFVARTKRDDRNAESNQESTATEEVSRRG